MSETRTTLALAAGLGAVAGLRSLTAPAVLSRVLARHPRRGQGAARWLATGPAPALLTLAAAGELVADKTPFIPNRTDPFPATGRVFMGMLVGAAVADHRGEPGAGAAIVGGLAALATTFIGYHLRRGAAEAGLPDLPVALAEDVVAVSTAAALAEAVG